ncbi:FAD/NAD(P)-binding domain-containing protein [Linnemannia elongata AG-77]|uniref:FAD/NAD(P)-binding domain-containing protein n=1 Tax=Linnemannia elongata AG-77 TaxID=1314771 RepID=A0A197JC58_9FUNG|nr:FAD/NAD(P)-binding domain-containing protein [Linnemannia elongata AG-77]
MAETLKQLNQYPGQGGRPKVLIVGAGLAGLTLGMLLHKAGIPFEIYERAAVVKPLGSAMYFNCTTANLFKQCGIYDEFVSLGKYVSSIKMCNEDRVVDFSMDFGGHEALYGANGYIIARPQVHDLLTRQIPKERIHYGAKVATTESNDNGVLIRFTDGSEVKGDILVGADGAYSAVRKGLYAKLKDEGKLPPSDDLPLPSTTVCVLAQTRPLTPEEFPDVAQEESQFRNFIATDKMYTWSTLTTAQNTVCWGSILFLDEESSKEDNSFSNSDWGQEAAMAMCEEVKDFPIIGGGDKKLTLKDLMDLTPRGHFSKVMLEEKVFETWYSGRTVLIGDACHKLNPAGGVGAANAIHDVIELANRINVLPFHSTVSDIEDAFKAYKSERIGWVTKAFENSKVFRTMVGQSTSSKITRFLVKHTPQWVMLKIERRQFTHRPQVAFLPLVEDRGYVKAAPQSSLAIKTPDETESSTIIQAV